MALFDLYQLAVLYNLRRFDAENISNRSHPPPMPPSTPPRRVTRSMANLPLHTPALPPPKTPQQGRDPVTIAGLTPNARGAAVRRKQEGDTDRVDRYDCGDYEEYIREDLSCRVFVDYEVFMKYVLHVPADWETEWGPTIAAVNANANFKKHYKAYCRLSKANGGVEKDLYQPLVETANAVLSVASRSRIGDTGPGKSQYYHVNDPNHINGGVMSKKGLCPDLVLLHNNRPCPEEKESLHWANPLHVLEVKSNGNAICDGTNMPKLVVDGKSSVGSFVRVYD